MKKILLIALCTLAFGLRASADEGMWLLTYLNKIYPQMKAQGLELKAGDIYNANGSSLKDAIVIFGRGCTGEIVSPDGLIFTNHHCGYANIQQLSSVEHDYLANGFWAMNRAEEIPVPGLSVQFIRSIEDVTGILTEGMSSDAGYEDGQAYIEEKMKDLIADRESQNPGKKILARPFYGGNQYFLFVIDEYKDIRFVGAPPTSIGKFGGDTDNWMWPRHTGDFSIFRVYAAPDGKTPAEYSKENVPYKAPKHLKISAKGYKEGDYAMIMGFPGTTNRYMTTYEIDEMLDVQNPNRIFIRGERQAILKKDMEASDAVRIKYAAKYAQSSNYWKNSIGMSGAIRKLNVRDEKQAQENAFTAWANADPSRTKYRRALPLIAESKAVSSKLNGDIQVLTEAILSSIEIGVISVQTEQTVAAALKDAPATVPQVIEDIYKDYNQPTDKKVAKRMIEIVMKMVPVENQPAFIQADVIERFEGNVEAYVNWLYDTSIYSTREKYEAFLAEYASDSEKKAEIEKNDPARRIYVTTAQTYYRIREQLDEPTKKFNEGHKLYIAGLLAMDPNGDHYPDANFTIRLTYGNIRPYEPADGVYYNYYTTLKGVMEKEDPTNPTEFTVPAKLKELYNAQDYGRYADFTGLTKKQIKDGAKGHINTCFISTNDITGGNSGSPVLNGRGELIGLAFDGNWEAMSGDVLFEPELQRCINLDVRYVLFVIDKFAGAGHLLDEMTIVWK